MTLLRPTSTIPEELGGLDASTAMGLLLGALAIVLGFAALAFVLTRFLYVCRPNEILIFAGRKHTLRDGTTVGYRILHGGRAVRIPLLETVARMDMRLVPVELAVQGAYSRGGIPLNVHAIANIKLTSNPVGALVTIDGEIAGTTPFDSPVVPGKHLIRVSQNGFISIEREVTFVEGVNEDLNFSLEKLPSRLPGRRWGYVSLGVGIVALAGGIGFAILDDRPFKLGGKCNDTYTGAGDTDYNNIPGDQSVTGNAECAKLWRTEPISIPLAVAGGALLTLGIAILVNSRQKTVKDKTKATASRRPKVGVGIGSISLSGRF